MIYLLKRVATKLKPNSKRLRDGCDLQLLSSYVPTVTSDSVIPRPGCPILISAGSDVLHAFSENATTATNGPDSIVYAERVAESDTESAWNYHVKNLSRRRLFFIVLLLYSAMG